MTTFMTHREDFPAYRAARSKFLTDDDALPASTLILCSGLADPDFRIEIEAVAAIP
jgi:enamine deaminase RidA (YjgF/YER057c/UK114 family)